jgi:PAS domain-containing protein
LGATEKSWTPTRQVQESKNKSVQDFEYRVITADNREIWVRGLVTVTVENGQVMKLYCVISEVTEKKRAEVALQQAHDELERQVEERTAALKKNNEQLQQEITERLRVEASLRESEEKYRRIF